ncbi:ArdC-like ssDNA-binding domain-containing protein [Bacillus sp. FSL R9-9410]|uniref:ArdC-like ssDNA-binding domain-containing protein n=1 Tax=Bacillus sp. FSL R9-9410 TaxID=2921590 RepID=UPI003101154E
MASNDYLDAKEETKEFMQMVLNDIKRYYSSVEGMLELAEFMDRFSNYSARNMQVIKSQFPEAYACANYKAFKTAGFSLKDGEKEMKVFHPRIKEYVRDPETKKEVLVKDLTVEQQEQVKTGKLKVKKDISYYLKETALDISQTNANIEDLKKIFPNRQFNFEVSDENKGLLITGLQTLVEKEKLVSRALEHNAYELEINSLDVVIRELVHESLHDKKGKQSEETQNRDFETQLASYIVCNHYGIDMNEAIVPSIDQWIQSDQELEQKDASVMRVHETARTFINTVDQKVSELQRDIEKELQTDKLGINNDNEQIRNSSNPENLIEEEHSVSDEEKQEKVDLPLSQLEILKSIQEKTERSVSEKMGLDLGNHWNYVSEQAGLNSKNRWEDYEIQLSEDGRVLEDIRPNMILSLGELHTIVNKFGTKEESENLDVITKKLEPYYEAELLEEEFFNTHIAKVSVDRQQNMKIECASEYVKDNHDNFDFNHSVSEAIDRINQSIMESHKEVVLQQETNINNEQIRGQSNPEKLITVEFTVNGEEKQGEVDLFVSKNIEGNEDKSMSNHIENVPGENKHLVTIEVLDKNIKNEEVASIHMMDADTKEFYDLSVWHVDESNRNDLYIAPMEQNGERDTVYLEDVLKHDVYEKVQDAIFDGKGHQSFVIHQENAKVNLDELVKGERYGKLVEKVEQKDFNFKDKEVEIYKEMKKEGYEPIKVIEKQLEDSGLVHVPSSGSNKEDVYRMGDARTIETERSGGTNVVKEDKDTPDVDKRYVGTEKVYSKENKQVDQGKEQDREQARRRYIMQQMGGRDY